MPGKSTVNMAAQKKQLRDTGKKMRIRKSLTTRNFMEAGNELKNDNDIPEFLQYGSN